MTVRALVVPVDGPGEVQDVSPELAPLQAIVGGWLEGIGPAGDAVTVTGTPAVALGWHAYCDEEGKLKQLPVNVLATKLAILHGWPLGDVLCGPVVFLGNGDDGEEADVPQGIVHVWEQLRRV